MALPEFRAESRFEAKGVLKTQLDRFAQAVRDYAFSLRQTARPVLDVTRQATGDRKLQFWTLTVATLEGLGADVNWTLPTVTEADRGKEITVVKAATGSNIVLNATPPATINQAATFTASTVAREYKLICDGKDFWVTP